MRGKGYRDGEKNRGAALQWWEVMMPISGARASPVTYARMSFTRPWQLGVRFPVCELDLGDKYFSEQA